MSYPPGESARFQLGMELEFISPPAPTSNYQGVDMYSERISALHKQQSLEFLARSLQQAGLPSGFQVKRNDGDSFRPFNGVHPNHPNVLGNFKYFDAERLRNMRLNEDSAVNNHWIVKEEQDTAEEGERAQWHAVELTTPIAPQSEIEARCPMIDKALRAIFHVHPKKAYLTKKCGLHVHVMPVNGLTLLQAKRTVTMLCMLDESLLFHLCSPIRPQSNGAIFRTCRFNYKPENQSPTNPQESTEEWENVPHGLWTSAPEAFHNIWSTRNLEGLINQLGTRPMMRPYLVAAMLVKEHVASGQHTIEYRHAQGSFNTEFIYHWICLVLTITQISLLPPERFRQAAQRMWDVVSRDPRPEVAWKPLLRVVAGCVPADWRLRPNENYWIAKVRWMEECAQRGQNPDCLNDGTARLN